jgi:hypothetical protein
LISPAEACAEMVFFLKHTKITDQESVKERMNIILRYFAQLSVRAYLQLLQPAADLNSKLIKRIDGVSGFYLGDDTLTQNPAELEIMKTNRWELTLGRQESFPSQSRSAFYLEKIQRLCAAYHVNLYFVFVPHYFGTLPSKSTFHYLSQKGAVLIPDIKPIMALKNWRDRGHLFQEGSRQFTRELVKLLKNGKEASPYYNYYKR